MIGPVLRALWRVLILLLGIASLFFVSESVWPDNNSRVAIFFALLIIYCLMAYVVIPELFRLYHMVVKHDHIPLYATYGDGWASDPVNIAIVAKNRTHLQKTMKAAGWYKADPSTLRNSIMEGISILFGKSYPNAPVSTLYLFNRKHDIAFEIPTNKQLSARTRHHVRFWKLEVPTAKTHDRGHFDYWSSKLLKWLNLRRDIWIGACTEDFKPIDIRWRTGSFTHGARHDADVERDFVVSTLKDAKAVKSVESTEPGEQFRFRGQSFRTIYTTDGSIKVVRLK